MDQPTAMVAGMSTGAEAVGEGIKLTLAHHCRIHLIEQQFFLLDYHMLDLMHQGRNVEQVYL